MMKKILLDPLLHFLVISVLLFVAYDALNPEEPSFDTISVTEGRVEQLNNMFVKAWQREPTEKELDNAIYNFVLNEAYAREAKALGLDKNDNAIRKRLRQKMEYMLEDMSVINEPSDAELKAYYQENSSKYLKHPQYSFSQIYISLDREQSELAAYIEAQQARVAAGQPPIGDVSMLAKENPSMLQPLVERSYGEQFAKSLNELPLQQWAGPVQSELGYHFVFIKERVAEQLKDFDAVRAEIVTDWRYQQNTQLKREFEKQLLDKYQVDIMMPKADKVSAL